MKYEKPEMELIVFEGNVYMALSLDGTNEEGTGPSIGYSSGESSISF